MRKAESKPKLWILLYDIHAPSYSRPTWKAILQFIRANRSRISGCLLGGDQLDYPSLSHWNKEKPTTRTKGALKREFDVFDREILTPLEKLLPRKAIRVWLDANHERFLTDWLEENPQLSGLVGHREYLRLDNRGWKFVALGGSYKIAKLTCIHGDVLSGGANPAKKALDVFSTNIVLGHFHAPGSASKMSPVDTKQKHMAWVSPIVGDVNPRWIKKRSNAWINGFCVCEVRGNRMFNLYQVVIVDGEFSYGSRTYSARGGR